MTRDAPKAADIAYLRLRAPDLAPMKDFLTDFGLHVEEGVSAENRPALFSRGSDSDPYLHIAEQGETRFLGLGFLMASEDELRALADLPGASEVHEITDAPGGGLRVRFIDPDGLQVDGVFGWQPAERQQIEERPPINTGTDRARLRQAIRLAKRRSQVKRLGHCVVHVLDFRRSEDWYKQRFGLLTSDEIYVGDTSNAIGAFLRCDRGELPVDHHSLFLLKSEESGLQHAAFEVQDWDDVMLGHDYLTEKGHTHRWGIGKHILGSQVFDYWQDPYGHMMEHFTDSDLFDAGEPASKQPVEALLSVQWGASFPS